MFTRAGSASYVQTTTWGSMDCGKNSSPQQTGKVVLPPITKTLMSVLSKIALEHWETVGRALRVAIDISIWSFQIQSGQKGSNPALRTFHYRLCRLLQSNIHPLFVFDGPHKPPFKRNRQTSFFTGRHWETQQLKRLITAFGFAYWDAPGEAEAECALLQRMGLVDLVMTEDVDSLMFGAGRVVREVSSGRKRSHVILYGDVERRTGLDRNALVLCAMMSGGDYLPAGVSNCGPKIAMEVSPSSPLQPSLTIGLTVVDCEGGVCEFIDENDGLCFLARISRIGNVNQPR